MTIQSTAGSNNSDQTAARPCDLDWLRTTTLPVATRAQTAQIFGVDERTITRGIEEGDIPAIRIGRRMLVPVPALRKMLGIEEGK
ncbi:MAG: hypothetical protein SV966_12510 [Actinomycetota bacterium]|nr:hypothetical protein [Actinomycetota bacterium]